jgi:hypothetical protein
VIVVARLAVYHQQCCLGVMIDIVAQADLCS